MEREKSYSFIKKGKTQIQPRRNAKDKDGRVAKTDPAFSPDGAEFTCQRVWCYCNTAPEAG